MTRRTFFANCAFTLIELLVVISIIGTLMGMSLVMIPRVRESSNITKCSANLTQWSQAVKAYTVDWNGRVPAIKTLKGEQIGLGAYFSLGVNNTAAATAGAAWDQWWMNSPVTKCPSLAKYYLNTPNNKFSLPIIGNTSANSVQCWNMNMMYASNNNLTLNCYDVSSGKILAYSQVTTPSKAALLVCGSAKWNFAFGFTDNNGGDRPLGIHYTKYSPGTWASGGSQQFPLLDDGRTNVLSFDGNIRLMEGTYTTGDYDDDRYFSLLASGAVSPLAASVKSKWRAFWNPVGGVNSTW